MAIKPGGPQDRIIKAARRLYFADGVGAVSTDRLAKEASVSKTTMYKYFPNTDDILRAVVEAEAQRFEAGVSLEIHSANDLRAALIAYGENLLGFLNEAGVLQFSRLMHEQARAHPEIARTFYDAAHGRTHAKLAALLDQAKAQQFIQSELDGAELAELLMGMWESLRLIRAQLMLTDRPYPNPGAWSRTCVATLLGQMVQVQD